MSMSWNSCDIREIVHDYLIDNLKIEVKNGGFTDPNTRIIVVSVGNTIIASEYFDVVQTQEYEG